MADRIAKKLVDKYKDEAPYYVMCGTIAFTVVASMLTTGTYVYLACKEKYGF